MSWREEIQQLPPEQRVLIEGGSLSQRFSSRPLGQSHPAIIGGFYGLLVGLALLLPYGYENGWTQDTLRDWSFISLLIVLLSAISGHFSLIVSNFTRRAPVSLKRYLIYPLPFLGLTILTVVLVTEIEAEISENLSDFIRNIGWMFILTPGPIYVHLSWAPRWRILCRLEEGLDPFNGELPESVGNDIEHMGEDEDMQSAIENIDDVPLQLSKDSEE